MDKIEPSRLFQDLLELEKDFKYNLTLLKIRDSEIERCDNTIKSLQEILKTKLRDITDLTSTVSNLEEALQKSELDKDKGKQICRQTVVKLTENLEETTRKFAIRLEQNEKEFEEEKRELEQFHRKAIEDKEEGYQKILMETEKRLRKEIITTSKARNQMQTLIDENMSLRNKTRQLESQYTSEIYFHKNELRTLQSTNSNLHSEIEYLQKNQASLRAELDEIKLEKDDLTTKSSVGIEKISNLIKQNKENTEENNKLARQIREYENLYKIAISNNEQLTFEKNQLEFERDDLKGFVENFENGSHCNVASHHNYEFVLKQNRVLQELVKAMKKERVQFQEHNAENERRVGRLEELVKVLKKKFFSNNLANNF